MSIKILIADDHRILREGLRRVIEKDAGLKIIAEAVDGQSAVTLARELSPDVVIMDITMPGLNGIEATRRILSEAPNIKILALSMHSDEQFVVAMLKAGASGYFLKECAEEKLLHAIRAVVGGETYLCSKIASIVVEDYLHALSKRRATMAANLTASEREVLQLVSEGQTSKEIAARLHMSSKSVETHRRKIMDKLNLHSIAGLTKYAIQNGMTSL